MATVLVTDDQEGQPVDTVRWAELARGVLEAEGVDDSSELSMLFTGEHAMAELNARFSGEDGPTDVLAFPLDDPVLSPATVSTHPLRRPSPSGAGRAPPLLGDLVICPAVAGRNAAHAEGSYDDEMALLVVHGILHLLGMDHEDPADAEAMRAREQDLLGRFHAGPASKSRP